RGADHHPGGGRLGGDGGGPSAPCRAPRPRSSDMAVPEPRALARAPGHSWGVRRTPRYAASVVATWAEFESFEPELAAFATERMARRIVYQATLRLDGGPRVHPV